MAELISISEHSDWLDNQSMTVEEKWNCHRKRVGFGKQPLEKWQFVPCKLVDGVWVVLEKQFYPTSMSFSEEADAHFKEYQQAKSLCLFEGFEFKEAKEESHFSFIRFPNKKTTPLYPKLWKGMTIEDLVKHKLTLTPAAEKQIGL